MLNNKALVLIVVLAAVVAMTSAAPQFLGGLFRPQPGGNAAAAGTGNVGLFGNPSASSVSTANSFNGGVSSSSATGFAQQGPFGLGQQAGGTSNAFSVGKK